MILYLDTSILVKLYVWEEGTPATRTMVDEAESIATSLLCYVETHAAFARKLREGGITPQEYTRTRAEFREDWGHYTIVDLGLGLMLLASELAERRALRALDALHLASALFLQSSGNIPIAFLSADRRLQEAAEAEGLEVFTLSS